MKSRTLTCITAIMLFAALAVPVQLAAQVSGVGITNRIPIWTNSTTLGNSNLFQTGGKVGIGTTIPAATLDVKGANGTANVSGGNAPMTLQVTGGGGATSNFGFGVQGAGEAGTVAAPAAIANAVIDALVPLGVTSLDVPLTSNNVWQAIHKARVAASS